MGKWCLHASSFIFYRIIIIVAGNSYMHKSSAKFDFGLNQTTHFGVTCPWVTKILHFWTWISLKPVGQSSSHFMYSIIGVREKLHKVLGQSGFHGNRNPQLTCFGAVWIQTLVSMATEIPHWLIIGKMMSPPFLGCFWSDLFYTCR